MEDKLTKEEVLHVANLARIEIDDKEIEMYQVKLKKLLDQIELVTKIDDNDSDYLIAPWNNNSEFRKDVVGNMLNPKEVLQNAPRKSGNYIEVPVVISNE